MNGKMMIVQHICGNGAKHPVYGPGTGRAHTMMRIDPVAIELQRYFAPKDITLTGTSDAQLEASINDELISKGLAWRVGGTAMDPGSCLGPGPQIWDPCGSADPKTQKKTVGRVFVLHRQDPDDHGSYKPVEVISRFENPAPVREFITEYCAIAQYVV